jgi:hypothetical protein
VRFKRGRPTPHESEERERVGPPVSPAPVLEQGWLEEMLANDEELAYLREEAMRPRYPRELIP